MNISLTTKGTKKAKLGMGLNQRGAVNVLGADDDGDSDHSTNDDKNQSVSSRAAVNQAVAQEQQALRKRAAAALASTNSDDYDYDGVYDDMPADKSKTDAEKKSDDARKSRYIEDLLKASNERKFQRDLIHERKVIKEQKEESQQATFMGKEEFVTASYKRKLQERQLWLEKEKAKEENEVTVESKGMAGFYGGLDKNVALGRAQTRVEDEQPVRLDRHHSDSSHSDDGKSIDFSLDQDLAIREAEQSNEASEKDERRVVVDGPDSPLVKREQIERKISDARKRYFQRHNMTEAQ
jgi:coiled-coil domain-containing protein 55